MIPSNEDRRQCPPELLKSASEGLQDEAVEKEEQAALGATIDRPTSRLDEKGACGPDVEPGLLGIVQVNQPWADAADRPKGRPEPMKHSLKAMHDGADSAREQTEPGASMEHVVAILRVMLKVLMDECLTAGWKREQVVKWGRWMPRVPPRCRLETGKRSTV